MPRSAPLARVFLVIVGIAFHGTAGAASEDSPVELLHRLEREFDRARVATDTAFAREDGGLAPGVRCATRPVPDVERGLIAAAVESHLERAGSAHRLRELRIPVAFHVLRRADGRWNVTDEQIDRQMAVVNDSFAGTGFSFFLAGVERIDHNGFAKKCFKSAVEKRFKRRYAVDPATTLNVYTCRPARGILGYAYLPSTFPEDDVRHGVVLHYASVPGGGAAPFDLGHTLVHEIGHYLGLLHTFQGRCGPKGDRVADTAAEERPAYGCPRGRDSCPAPGADPITNFMDYTDDACTEELTPGQVTRMMDQTATFKPSL